MKRKIANKKNIPACGLCGSTRKRLMKTECCGNWICDDEDNYVLFSYARNSCSRNHRRYTLCEHHAVEEHTGGWKTCKECRNSFETEDYVWYGTNAYNFEILPDPPKFNPTHCSQCEIIINRGEDGYTQLAGDKFLCELCGSKHMDELTKK